MGSPEAPIDTHVLLTPRAAETAIGAGIVAVRPNFEAIAAIGEFVNQRFTEPGYRFPEQVDELAMLMRWSGKGNRIMGRWDTIFDKAPGSALYVTGQVLSPPFVEAARQGHRMAASVPKSELDPAKTVELHIDNWGQPDFGRKLVRGILFNWHGRSDRPGWQNLVRDISEAFGEESLRRYDEVRVAGQVFAGPPEPFTRVFAPVPT